MAKIRKTYELSGIDVAYAYTRLNNLVDFKAQKMVCFPGRCSPKFDYSEGKLKSNENIRVSFFRRRNRGRVVIRYDNDSVQGGYINHLMDYVKKQEQRDVDYWQRAKQSVEKIVEGIRVPDLSIFSDNQLVFR